MLHGKGRWVYYFVQCNQIMPWWFSDCICTPWPGGMMINPRHTFQHWPMSFPCCVSSDPYSLLGIFPCCSINSGRGKRQRENGKWMTGGGGGQREQSFWQREYQREKTDMSRERGERAIGALVSTRDQLKWPCFVTVSHTHTHTQKHNPSCQIYVTHIWIILSLNPSPVFFYWLWCLCVCACVLMCGQHLSGRMLKLFLWPMIKAPMCQFMCLCVCVTSQMFGH